jgi:uncharacterized damage-inducible protein DinB
MLIETLILLYKRDLENLKKEILAYRNEAALWKTDREIPNSAGNLCLHLIGNLNHFIGAQFGASGYVRQRDLEFSRKDVPRDELVAMIEATIIAVEQGLRAVTEDQLAAEYPLLVFAEKTSTEYMLVHLSTHLSYHLGQINYHRRLLDN